MRWPSASHQPGKDQPDEITSKAQRPGADVFLAEIFAARDGFSAERQQRVGRDIERRPRPGQADNSNRHDRGGDEPRDRHPDAAKEHPQEIKEKRQGRHGSGPVACHRVPVAIRDCELITPTAIRQPDQAQRFLGSGSWALVLGLKFLGFRLAMRHASARQRGPCPRMMSWRAVERSRPRRRAHARAPLCQACRGVGIVRRQINRRLRQYEAFDPVERVARDSFIGADAVHFAGEHQLFRVGGVAGEQYGGVLFLYHDRNMVCGVARRGDGDDVAGRGQFLAGAEGPERLLRRFKAPDRTRGAIGSADNRASGRPSRLPCAVRRA